MNDEISDIFNYMKLNISAKPNSREVKVEKIDESEFVVCVKEPPVQGRANRAVIDALAEYFGISKGRIKIISGWTSRNKIIEIL